jgi:REP element-mobilizing transposase RayT
MGSHIHLLCKANEYDLLSNVIRDFKTFTSKKIIETIIEYPESRREWMLEYFSNACEHLKRNQKYKVWQDGYHAEKIYSNAFIKQKVNYIHNNPVAEKIVEKPAEYLFSSARNYADLDSEIDVIALYLF